jgi:signal peptidase II
MLGQLGKEERGYPMEFEEKTRGLGLRNSLLMAASLALVFIGVVGLDQVSKIHAHSSLLVWEDPQDADLYRGGRSPVFAVGQKYAEPGAVPFFFQMQFQYSRNRGAAFSMLSDLPDKVRVPFFYAVTAIAVVLIGFYLRSTPAVHHLTRLGLVMILSGAIGNFLDRLTRGYVVDFIDTEWNILGWQHNFAIFNVADVAINIGVAMLLIEMLFQWIKERRHLRQTGATVAAK